LAATQSGPSVGPPLSGAEATWTAFWTHVNFADLRLDAAYLPDQMAFGRIDPTPTTIRNDAIWYPEHCRHGVETADWQVHPRLDFDAVWRITAL
jgi:hypothetical protein